uniref:Addiction module killer protein n=1 Tax=Prevotella sp. GTC17262 TaxID=3236797 RepID=A0AB33JL41_9BACT
MIVTFEEPYLQHLYEQGTTTDKKHRYQPQVIRGFQKGVKYMEMAKRPDDLRRINSLNFEALKGDKQGLFSIRANDKYCIEFTIDENLDMPILTICNITDLSNHYK